MFIRILKTMKKMIVLSAINHILCGTHFFSAKRFLLRLAGVKIGENTKIVGPIHLDNSEIEIGNNCWLGRGFCVYGNGKVKIGNNCDFAPDIVLETGSHEIGLKDRRAGLGFNKDIVIGNGCWMGLKSNILSGVHIGSGCIVAAGAVVTKSFEDDSMIGGVPAKRLRRIQ